MVDTQRSISQILSLFANNNTGDISPQDLRDAVVTLELAYGEIYVTTPTATVISNTVDYFDVAGTYGLGVTGRFFDMNTNGQLRYIGNATIEALVFCTLSMTIAGNNDVIHLRVAKNGTSLEATDATRKVGTGADVGSMSVVGLVSLDTNDYLTVEVRNETATDNVTAEHLTLASIGFTI